MYGSGHGMKKVLKYGGMDCRGSKEGQILEIMNVPGYMVGWMYERRNVPGDCKGYVQKTGIVCTTCMNLYEKPT
jgi:hypothetical protein